MAGARLAAARVGAWVAMVTGMWSQLENKYKYQTQSVVGIKLTLYYIVV